MLDVVFKRALEEYFSNIKVALSFGVLFLFLALFIFFGQFFFSSGTVFLSFNTDLITVVGLVLMLVFLYVFSFFVSLTVYATHRGVQTLSIDTYWGTLFRDAALKIFFLYLLLSIIFFIVSGAGFYFGIPLVALVINLVIGLIVFFAPQSIVLDEATLPESISSSIEFWKGNLLTGIAIFIVACVLLAVIFAIELVLDLASLPGGIVSFILVLVFLVPFIEQAKSYAYLMKVALLKSNEFVHARAPRGEHAKPHYGVRLRERPRQGKL